MKAVVELSQQAIIQPLLTGQRAGFGRQRLVFKLLEFGNDEAFSVFKRLTANIVSGCLLCLGAGQLDKIAMYPVVAHLEIGKPRTLAFTNL